jgi:hypothetical protein
LNENGVPALRRDERREKGVSPKEQEKGEEDPRPYDREETPYFSA